MLRRFVHPGSRDRIDESAARLRLNVSLARAGAFSDSRICP